MEKTYIAWIDFSGASVGAPGLCERLVMAGLSSKVVISSRGSSVKVDNPNRALLKSLTFLKIRYVEVPSITFFNQS